MSARKLILLLSTATAANLCAASPVGLLPEEKQPVLVAEIERNPFGKPGPKLQLKTEDTQSEEARIRGILDSLNISGFGERDGEYSVLVGSLFVKAGSELPAVVPDQTERLRVLKVEKNSIEIGFVEKDETAESRKILLEIALKPQVRYDLGVKATKIERSGTLGGVTKPDETSPK